MILIWGFSWIKNRLTEYSSLPDDHENEPSPESPDQNGKYGHAKDPEKHYAELLNIEGRPTPDEIERVYRRQIAKYHPDKVQHLGEEFQEMAERKTKEINAAYDYFRRKYRF
jgi:DnaJ-domain-containing protein 1